MRHFIWNLAFMGGFLVAGPRALAWPVPEELKDIADEIDSLAQAVPSHSFEERNLLGREVKVTLPQLEDRLDDVEERLRIQKENDNGLLEDIAAVKGDLKATQAKAWGIEQAEDEPAYVMLQKTMRQGLLEAGRRMNGVLIKGLGEESENLAH